MFAQKVPIITFDETNLHTLSLFRLQLITFLTQIFPHLQLRIGAQRKNTVMLGDAEQLRTEYMLTEQDNLIDEQEFFSASDLTVRIRYRSKPIPVR